MASNAVIKWISVNQFSLQERVMHILVSTFILMAMFLTRRILNQSLQTCKHLYQPRKTVTISPKHHPRRAYRWLQLHHQWRSAEYATVRQSQINLWFLLVCVPALCSMYIRAVCRDGLRVRTQRNANCVNMSSAWNPRWSPLQRFVSHGLCSSYTYSSCRKGLEFRRIWLCLTSRARESARVNKWEKEMFNYRVGH